MKEQNERFYATEKDYYVAHGKKAYFRSYTKYSDIEALFAEINVADMPEAAHEFPYPEDMRWCSQYCWLRDYYTSNGKFPTTRSSVSSERGLARWLSELRANPALTPKQIALLNLLSPKWNYTKEDIWGESLKKASEFYLKNGRLPRNTEDEKVMRVWIDGNKRGVLSSERRARLDQFLPGWDETELDRWYKSLEKVAAFYREHKKAPLRTKGKSQEERSMGDWLTGVRHDFRHTNKLNPDQIAALEANVPGWSNSFGTQWETTLNEVAEFFKTYGHLPELSDMGTHGSLGKWIITQRENLGSSLTQERFDALNQNVPGWDETLDQRWERKLSMLVEYVTLNDTFPSDKDAEQSVKNLGSWYQIQKRKLNKGNLDPSRKDALDAAIPHWDDLWSYKLHKASIITDSLGKLPSSKGPHAETGRWICRQRRDRAKLSAQQVAFLNARLPSWDAA